MKLLYTDIRTSLTEALTREAEELVAAGKRVFYIAPNSLSFEKERAVLEYLSQQASFAITVTRFAQMACYLILNDLPAEKVNQALPLVEGIDEKFFEKLSNDRESFNRMLAVLEDKNA